MEDEKDLACPTEIQAAIEQLLTKDIYNKLIKYGIYRLASKFNIKYDLNRGFQGLLLEDLISEVILSFLNDSGGRNWNKIKFPNFEKQLTSAFDSHICNTVKKNFGKLSSTIYDEDSIEDKSEDNNYENILNDCLEFLEEDGASYEEIQLFEPYFIHKMKREEIAKQFHIALIEVTKIKQKINTRLPRLVYKLNQERL